jgi:hypothetical protein
MEGVDNLFKGADGMLNDTFRLLRTTEDTLGLIP